MAALEAAGVPIVEFWRQSQADYRYLLSRNLGAEGTVGDTFPSDFWPAG
jgi:hypothetical protein